MSEPKTIHNGRVLINLKELNQFKYMGGEYDYGLMSILKSKGAPIVGTFLMRPDIEGYSWVNEYRPHLGEFYISWDKLL